MNPEQLQQLQQDAHDTLADMDFDHMNKDRFLLCGASMAILGLDNQSPIQTPQHGQISSLGALYSAPAVAGYHNPIDDELDAAEGYYNMWVDTGLPEYKHMAKDEMKHSEFLLKQARERGEDITQYKIRHDSIAAKLS